MSSSLSQLEEAVFQSMVPTLEAEGFSVFVHPSRNMLPAFLSTYQPDAIAYKGDRKIAIEVMAQQQSDGPKVERIQRMFSDHPEWELRLVYAPPGSIAETMPALSRDHIEAHLRQVEASLESMGGTAALLMAWAIFEAAARRSTPASLARPQSPSRLIEVLAADGHITPDEADMLRGLSSTRNAVAHGQLDLDVSRADVGSLMTITRAILDSDG